jgi:hypothetical protein
MMMPEISTNRLAINYDLGVLSLMLVAMLALFTHMIAPCR